MTGDCVYLVDGIRCDRDAVATRLLPVRSDLPCPDSVSLDLCYFHAKAWDMWQGSQRVREAEARARR